MKIHKLSGTNTLDDTRFACKSMANKISTMRFSRGKFGRFPMRQITEKVRQGNVTLHELDRWYVRAIYTLIKR